MFRLIGSSVAYKSHALIFNSHATHCKPKIHIDKGSKIFTKVGSTCLKKRQIWTDQENLKEVKIRLRGVRKSSQ